MHKFLTLLLVISSVTLSSCAKDKKKNDNSGGPAVRGLNKADFPNVAGAVQGRWLNDETTSDKGFIFHMKLFVNRTQVGIEIECENLGRRTGASFAVMAAIDDKNIEILEAGSKTEKSADGRSNCTASIAKGKFGYFMVNNSLILTAPTGAVVKNMTFTRIP